MATASRTWSLPTSSAPISACFWEREMAPFSRPSTIRSAPFRKHQ
jgi:hypothetical protein